MRTIEEAERDCRAAWEAHPEATHGWCIHHDVEIEWLSEPIAERINYILTHKPVWELVVRLDNLRPVVSIEAIQAEKRYAAERDKAEKRYEAETAPARKVLAQAVAPIHRAEVPGHTWSGTSILEEEQP